MRIYFVLNEYEDEHLGLMYLSALLKKDRYEPEILPADYATIHLALSQIESEPVVLCFSATSFSILKYVTLSKRLKEEFSFVAVFGGYYVSGNPHVIEQEGVDAVCIGEGEYAFCEFAAKINQGQSCQNVQNFWIKEKGQIYKNQLRPLITTLDDIPFPDRSLFSNKSVYYHDRIYVLTSRGCTYSCPHCYNSTYETIYEGHRFYRRRSVDNVIAEIEEVMAVQPVRYILFYDDIFIVMPEWVKEFSEKYKKRINIPFRCNVRINLITPEILTYLKAANCHCLSYGLETGNDTLAQTVLHRNLGSAEFIEKSKMIAEHGIKQRTSNMIGLPGGSIKDDFKTIELNVRCGVDYALVSLFRTYPKTTFAQSADPVVQKDDFKYSISQLQDHCSHDELAVFNRLSSSQYEPEFGFADAHERMMVSNLHELFSFAVSFPYLIPLIRIVIHFPFKKLYVHVNYLWSCFASFFVLYPTQNMGSLLRLSILRRIKKLKKVDKGTAMPKKEKVLFPYSLRSHIRLNAEQKRMRDDVLKKIETGVYVVEETVCLCQNRSDRVLAERDRYGFPLRYVVCSRCGLVRMNPSLTVSSLREFYRSSYRVLFLEKQETLAVSHQKQVEAGHMIYTLIKQQTDIRSFSGMRILDIGCGTGGTLLPFADAGAVCRGFDLDEECLAYGREANPQLCLEQRDVCKGLEAVEKYDIVLCSHFLEHTREPQHVLESIRSVLNENGVAYLSVPHIRNAAHYASPIKSFLGALHISHLYLFSKKTLLPIVHGFDICYVDDVIHAVLRKKAGGQSIPFVADNDDTRDFIYTYERHFFNRTKRYFYAAVKKLRGCINGRNNDIIE